MDWVFVLGLVLLLIGFILAAVEMAVPGFGAPGIGGIICLIAGICCTADSLADGIFITLITLTILAVMLGIILWLLSKGKFKSPLILEEEQKKDLGYISSEDLNYLLGKSGKAVTDLKPSGIGCFEDINFDVVSDGPFLERGTAVKIIKVRGSVLVVTKSGDQESFEEREG